MDTEAGDPGFASALLAVTEGATHGRGPAGVLTTLVTLADNMIGVATGAVTGGSDGVDPGSLVTSREDPDGLFAVGFDEGPGREGVRTGRLVGYDDVRTERPRWLRFVAKSTSAGLSGAWAVPIRRGDESMGSMLLLGRGRPDLATAASLAEAAAVGLRHAHALHRAEAVGDQLREALRSRVVIEQAKGALALHTGTDVEEAFALLRRHARHRGEMLTDLARRVVAGEVDPSVVTRPPLS